ncbi:MAG TPA: UPF0262 family protein [Acetobacteraceae bacterium]|jgi:uncharacterized protein (UPF0262 family)|nr:UPF0262 family protein [Acetobacteraceae bacterium]
MTAVRPYHGSPHEEDPGAPPASGTSLARVVLVGEAPSGLSPALEADRAQAIADLERENCFQPVGLAPGPYELRLSIEGGLLLDIRDCGGRPLIAHLLALGPFRRLIKDYHLLVESYAKAVQEGREARLQAIDMGRRGLHNEAARLLTDRLAGKVTIDLETARRLFTLLAVLHQRV